MRNKEERTKESAEMGYIWNRAGLQGIRQEKLH